MAEAWLSLDAVHRCRRVQQWYDLRTFCQREVDVGIRRIAATVWLIYVADRLLDAGKFESCRVPHFVATSLLFGRHARFS